MTKLRREHHPKAPNEGGIVVGAAPRAGTMVEATRQ
jgi:hypothetical protein